MNEDLQNLTYPKKSAIDDYWTKDLDKVYIKNPDTESNFSKGKSSTETQIPLRTIRWVQETLGRMNGMKNKQLKANIEKHLLKIVKDEE